MEGGGEEGLAAVAVCESMPEIMVLQGLQGPCCLSLTAFRHQTQKQILLLSFDSLRYDLSWGHLQGNDEGPDDIHDRCYGYQV